MKLTEILSQVYEGTFWIQEILRDKNQNVQFFGSKMILASKNLSVQKNLGPHNVYEKKDGNVGPEKFWVQFIIDLKKFWSKNFGSKIFQVQNILGQTKFGSKKKVLH